MDSFSVAFLHHQQFTKSKKELELGLFSKRAKTALHKQVFGKIIGDFFFQVIGNSKSARQTNDAPRTPEPQLVPSE
jgi:hypothetical protein